MEKRIIIFKKCYCKDNCRRAIIITDWSKTTVYHLTKCKDCCWNSEVFPDKLINTDSEGVFKFSDGKRFIEWRTRCYTERVCYLYEEEQI